MPKYQPEKSLNSEMVMAFHQSRKTLKYRFWEYFPSTQFMKISIQKKFQVTGMS